MTLLLLALLQSPAASLGFEPGADSMLADWTQVSTYLNGLAQRSPYVHVDTLGPRTRLGWRRSSAGRDSSPIRGCSARRSSPTSAPPNPPSS